MYTDLVFIILKFNRLTVVVLSSDNCYLFVLQLSYEKDTVVKRLILYRLMIKV